MLSVVIINKNRLNYLALKLQSLRYQTNFSNLDLLVVDYSDTDEAVEYCRRVGVRSIRVKGEFNISKARNVGIRHAHGEWICISGNDTLIDRKYFNRLSGMIEAGRGQKVFFSGSFAHFVKRQYHPAAEKMINAAFLISDLLRALPPHASINPFRTPLLQACVRQADDRDRRSISHMIRKALQFRRAENVISPVLSWNLLTHLLGKSLEDHSCLAPFHDYIFSKAFLRNKCILTYSFQTFSRDMAEELHGYDESFENWGTEDYDFGVRAQHLGYTHVPSKLVCLHLEHPENRRRNLIESESNVRIMKNRIHLVQPHWGLSQPTEEIC